MVSPVAGRQAVVAGVLAALLAGAVAASSTAAGPPVGKYGCTMDASGDYAGELYLLDGSHYRVNSSKAGTYTVSGKKLAFPSGVYKGLLRGVYKATTHPKGTEIDLIEPSTNNLEETCQYGA